MSMVITGTYSMRSVAAPRFNINMPSFGILTEHHDPPFGRSDKSAEPIAPLRRINVWYLSVPALVARAHRAIPLHT